MDETGDSAASSMQQSLSPSPNKAELCFRQTESALEAALPSSAEFSATMRTR